MIGPLAVQAGLTFVLLVLLGQARVAAVRKGEVRIRDIAMGQSTWPETPALRARAYQNQFEIPILFFASGVALMALDRVGWVALGLACAFALSRLIHAWVHLSNTNIMARFRLFFVGFALVVALWGVLLLEALGVAVP